MHEEHNHHDEYYHQHPHTLAGEFICHFPHAVFSVLFSLIILSLFNFIGIGKEEAGIAQAWDELFHNFHFMHIVFASIGTVLTFFRFSQNKVRAALLGLIAPSIFCVLSDIIFPYLGGRILGVHMHLHICFFREQLNVLPFLLVGLVTGMILGANTEHARGSFSKVSHFMHIFVSSLASSFYMVAHGFSDWSSQIGAVFIVLVAAVVVPCTLADVVVPMVVARLGTNK